MLDVKVGTGAFMKDVDQARELAETMVALGKDAGVHTVALLTDMSTPLGITAGNAIEVAESVEVLAGGGPADVVELTLALAREMLAGCRRDRRRPRRQARRRVGDGRLEGDDPRPGAATPTPPCPRRGSRTSWPRPSSGVLTRLDAMAVGLAAWRLGAGRAKQGDPCRTAPASSGTPARATTSPRAQPLFTLLTDDPDRFDRALASLEGGYDIAPAGRRTNPRPWSSTASADRCRASRGEQQEYDALGDAGGLGLALDLDDVLEGELLARGQVGDLADGDGAADARADPDRVAGSAPCSRRS